MDARFLELPIYDLPRAEKGPLLRAELERLTRHHAAHCEPYSRLLDAMAIDPAHLPGELPALTVRQFKQQHLQSIPDDQVFKTLLSSGTGGQPSTIVLDRDSAATQSKVLVKIMQHWLGKQRLPMLIADHPGVIKDRERFSARGAGIQGMSMLGRDHTYALRDDMSFDRAAVTAFAEKHAGGPVLIFGFTYMVWQYFVDALIDSGIRFPDGILLHGGGWKKLQDQAVDNATFKARLAEAAIERVHNYYGMVEQTGAIFVECEQGHLHAPVHADVVVRDLLTGRSLAAGEEGVIELHSVLPESYPGHILLTEDMGSLVGEDDCACGRRGRYFHVHGRIPQAEARGCSDTFDSPGTSSDGALSLLAGSEPEQVAAQPVLPPFADAALAFLGALSDRLLKDRDCRAFPDLVALGFWLRPAALKALAEQFRGGTGQQRVMKAAGTVLHIAPSNVDTLFAYSWALSLLAGNSNLIRVSSKETPQRALLLRVIRALLKDDLHTAITQRTALLAYDRDDALTTRLSLLCQRRVVWGGDATVSHIRSLPLPPLAQEIVFPDRHSLALLDAAAVSGADTLDTLLEAFQRDIYSFNQQACSSPRLVLWLGNEAQVQQAGERFWPAMRAHLAGQPSLLSTAELMNKQCALQAMAMQLPLHVLAGSDHRIELLETDSPSVATAALAQHGGGGLLLQARIDSLSGLSDWLTPQAQTLAYHGVPGEQLRDWLLEADGITPDRIVPLGQSLAFEGTWDGIDLVRALSRTLVVR